MSKDDGDIVINLRMDDKDFAVTVRNSGRILRSFRDDLNKTATGVDSLRGHFSSFSTSFRHTIQMFATARFAVLDFYDVMLRLPKSILETAGEIEKLTKLMEGMSKATTQAGKAMEASNNRNFVIEMAKKAPFELKALADAFVKLKTGGTDPLNGSMQALADSVAKFGGGSEAMHRASVAIQQMGGKGVISMEELRQQLGEAIPDAMQMMAQGMGLSMAELTKKVSLGAVESTDALRRMFTMMEFHNKGAALKMMDTWTGLTARLKTEWTLLQTVIGDSGFSEAVKVQLKDLIALMSSDSGIAMAKQFGQDLAKLVYFLREVADGLRENWTLIKMVGQAIIVAFGVSKMVAIGKGLTQIFQATSAVARKSMADLEMKTRADASSLATTLTANAKEIEAEAAKQTAMLAKREIYYQKMLARHASYMNQIRILEAKNDITGAKISVGGSASDIAIFNSRNKKIEALESQAKSTEKLIGQERIRQATMQAGINVTNQAAEGVRRNADAATKASMSVGLFGKAAIGARVALGALGGPLGLITTALIFGIPAWLEWGNAGEKAIQRIKDALNSKSANKDTVKLIDEQIESKKAELDALTSRELIANNRGRPIDGSARAKLEKELGDLKYDRREANSQMVKNEADRDAINLKANYQKQTDTVLEFYRQEHTAIVVAATNKLEGLKKGSKEEIEIEKNKTKAIHDNVKASGIALFNLTKQQHDHAEAALKNAQNGGSDSQIAAAKATRDALSEELILRDKYKTETAHLSNPIVTKEEKVKKPDALTQALEQARGDLESAKITMEDILDGTITLNKLKEAAFAEVMGDRAAGRFSAKDERGNMVAPSANNSQLKELADIKGEMKGIERNKQAMSALNRLQALSDTERKTAAERFDSSEYYERETTGVHKLQRQIAGINMVTVDGIEPATKYKDIFKNIIGTQAIADLVNFSADLKKLNVGMIVALEDTDIGQKSKGYELEMAELRSQLDQRKKAILDNNLLTNEEANAQIVRATEEINAYMLLKARDQAKKMRSPLQQLAVEWEDVTKRMRDASVRWANDSMDAFINFAKTGKFEWHQLAESILTDILRIRLQQTIGPGMNKMMDQGVNALAGLMGAKTTAPDGTVIDPTIDRAMNAQRIIDVGGGSIAGQGNKMIAETTMFEKADGELVTMWDKVGNGFNTVWTGLTSMLGNLGTGLTSAISGIASMMTGGGGGGFLGSLLSAAGSMAGSMRGGGKGAIGAGATSNGASAAFGNNSGSMFAGFSKFAEGGVMTPWGPMALRKYSAGGVANFPQMSVHGEGSRPEAYVPLPDGRTIPVSMSGGGGGGKMIVNVYNNASGTKAETKEGKDKDGNMTMDIMIEQIEGKISKNVASGRGSLAKTMEKSYGLNRGAGGF